MAKEVEVIIYKEDGTTIVREFTNKMFRQILKDHKSANKRREIARKKNEPKTTHSDEIIDLIL